MALISRLSLTGLCAALMLSQPAFAAKVITVDRIVAVINKNVITARELDERLRLTQANLKRQNVTPPAEDVLRAQLLDRMINDEVQLQFASDNGIRVDDAQLDAALNRIAEQNQLTLPQLKEALAKDGIPFDRFRDDIRREILMNRVKEREVEDRIFISDAEVDSFLKQQAAEQGHGSEFLLQNIVVTVPEQASPEVVREREQRAQAALAELKAGKPFAEVAAAYSNAGNAMQGGQLGWRPGNRLPDIYVEVASKLDKGQLSTLVKTANGFHIIQLLDKRQSNDALVVEQVHARHILIKTNEAVSEGDAKARLVAIKERLDNGGKFEELARLHSEDSSASKGGDLGWLTPGDTVPEFEKAMNTLSLNQVSGPVRSQFGWHLIQVLERRKQDVSGDRARLEARQALKERKADEQYEEWVRQQRDSAFVEVKLQDE